MKKIVLVLLILMVSAGFAVAFDILSFPPPLEDGGKFMIDVGAGFKSNPSLIANWVIPPLFAQVEYALPVKVPLSVGGGFSFYQIKYENSYGGDKYGWRVTYMTPQVRVNWHWGFDVKWLDFYTGMWLGYEIAVRKYTGNWGTITRTSDAGSYFGWGFQAGVHFYFSKYFGLMVETGYPYWIKGGIAIKF